MNKVGRVSDKVVMISGGARGMGAAEARMVTAEGAKVLIGDLLDQEGMQLANELGNQARYVHLDVTNPADWEKAVKVAELEFGPVNVLVNNAGINNYAPFEDYTIEQFRQVMEVNLYGNFYGMKAVVPSMKTAGNGSIINISSTAGINGYPLIPGYVASKWAVRGLTKSVALELGKYNIRVNSIHPGQICTPMTDNGEMATKHIALKRVGFPDDIAHVVLFMASDESKFITGTELIADGGETCGRANWGQ
jgi:Dehydrogenases with different specificities (related to short-chain alcohol dehydrogenases)